MTERRIFMSDVRRAHMCSGGARDFFIRHNLDWNSFLKEGIPESKLIELNDELGLIVIKEANK